MKFENIEKFHAFLEANLRPGATGGEARIRDLERRIEASAANVYELTPKETKSGKREAISFSREQSFYVDDVSILPDGGPYTYVETIITF